MESFYETGLDEVVEKMNALRYMLLASAVLLLSACLGPKTPQEVTASFWDAVLRNDAGDVVEYSTLLDVKQYDRFAMSWQGYQASWGRVVIDGDEASVESRLALPGGREADRRDFVTYLVHRDGKWFVDYERTGEAVRGNPLSRLLGKLSEAGKELSVQLEAAAGQMDSEMQRLGAELEKLAGDVDKEASAAAKQFAEDLQKSLRELEESINRALEDKDRELSDRDRRLLQEVSADLDKDSDNLSDGSVQSIADGSKDIASVRIRLDSVDDQTMGEYKRQWREWGEKTEADLQKVLERLSAEEG